MSVNPPLQSQSQSLQEVNLMSETFLKRLQDFTDFFVQIRTIQEPYQIPSSMTGVLSLVDLSGHNCRVVS